MRLLLIGPEARDRSALRNFSGVWSHYLTKEFEKSGIPVQFDPPLNRSGLPPASIVSYYRTVPLDGFDHVLALGTRYFEKVPAECVSVLRSRCAGAVAQMHDGMSRAGVDCTFTVKKVDLPRHHYVGWAADPDLLRPAQDREKLRILVDHPDYVPRRDQTRVVLNDVKRFMQSLAWSPKFKSIEVWRIADGEVVHAFKPVARYMRQSVPFEKICEEYARAHLFLVTHRESIGLSVLETAMAGALPVVQKGFVPRDRLLTVRHVEYQRVVPWGNVMASINPEASREMALANTWDKIAERIIAWLSSFRRK